jgi:hypothetical protein
VAQGSSGRPCPAQSGRFNTKLIRVFLTALDREIKRVLGQTRFCIEPTQEDVAWKARSADFAGNGRTRYLGDTFCVLAIDADVPEVSEIDGVLP